jgi:HPt (histidine-containing phosphotransfer) domain-containing protein
MPKQIIQISDEDLKEILPGYLKKRLAEVIVLQQLFIDKDYTAIRSIAHNLKGTGLSYGLEGAGDIGTLLEDAIKAADYDSALVHFKSLKDYFDNLEVIYT